MKKILKVNPTTIKIAVVTAVAILVIKSFNTLLVYHFFSFDKYLTGISICFLAVGYFLASHNLSGSRIPLAPSTQETVDKKLEELKRMRFNLTNREVIVFMHLSEGKTNKEISPLLFVEISTVKTHINNLFSKISCKTRKEAMETWKQMVYYQLI